MGEVYNYYSQCSLSACMRTSEEVAAIVKVRFPECPLFGGRNTWQKRLETMDSVHCPEFRGGRFSGSNRYLREIFP